MKKTIAALTLSAAVALSLTACRTDAPVTDSSSSVSVAPGHANSGGEPELKHNPPGAAPTQPDNGPTKAQPPRADTSAADHDALVSISRTALGELKSIPTKGRAPKTGYSRDAFGKAWDDDVSVTYGHNGCDTRNDVLRRDMTKISYKGSSKCLIATGVLADPYTGKTIDFVRGSKTSTKVQIDHVVALSNAWQTGAQQLSPEQRRNLANDPRNLLAVDGPANGAKSDGDAATWLPANKSYRCTYVAKQVSVKKIYKLWMTTAEHRKIEELLTGCAG